MNFVQRIGAFYTSSNASKALEDQENGQKSEKHLKMLIQGLGVTFIRQDTMFLRPDSDSP